MEMSDCNLYSYYVFWMACIWLFVKCFQCVYTIYSITNQIRTTNNNSRNKLVQDGKKNETMIARDWYNFGLHTTGETSNDDLMISKFPVEKLNRSSNLIKIEIGLISIQWNINNSSTRSRTWDQANIIKLIESKYLKKSVLLLWHI